MALSDHRQGFPEDVFYFFHGQMERLDLASLGRSLSCFFSYRQLRVGATLSEALLELGSVRVPRCDFVMICRFG